MTHQRALEASGDTHGSRSIGQIACLKVLLLVLAYLALAEVLLELRGYLRGWETIAFGRPTVVQKASGHVADTGYGPAPGFPFRSRVIPVSRTEGTKRLWIASSSYGFADNLPANEIFPNRIPGVLEDQGIRSEVINASRIGLVIEANNGDLRQLGKEWRPDYAVLYQMSNDVTLLSKRFLSTPIKMKTAEEGERNAAPSPLRFESLGRLLEKTTLYAHLQTEIRSRLARNRILFDSIGAEAEQEFEDSVKDFLRSCRSMKVKPILCTFAVSDSIKDFRNWSTDLNNFLFRYNIFLSTKGWASTLDRFNSIIRSVAKENDVVLVDVDHAVGGQRRYFRDFVHFTPTGHEIVARLIADAVAQDINTRHQETNW